MCKGILRGRFLIIMNGPLAMINDLALFMLILKPKSERLKTVIMNGKRAYCRGLDKKAETEGISDYLINGYARTACAIAKL